MKRVVDVPAARVAVLGDLHLGRIGSPLACAVPAGEIAAAAAALRSEHELVVVNGDLYDLERGTTPSQRREYDVVSPAHRATEEALSAPGIVWVRGNHDRVLARLGRAVDAVEVATPCGRFRVEHGDRFDPPIKRWPAFTTLVTWASGRARSSPALMPAYRAMRVAERMLGRLSGWSFGDASAGVHDPVTAAAARWLQRTTDCDGLVIGHTHAPVLLRLGRRLLANPGPSTDRIRALSLDGLAGVALLLEWQGDGFHETARIDLAPPG